MSNTIRCTCGCAKTRHKQEFGEPHTGPCRDCGCQKMQAKPITKFKPGRLCRYPKCGNTRDHPKHLLGTHHVGAHEFV